jgi:hypothetical protein
VDAVEVDTSDGRFSLNNQCVQRCRLSAWPSGLGRAPSCFIAHEFGGSRVQTPGADRVSQAVHPSGVGKLVATSKQWVTAVEDCEGKSVRLFDGWRTAYAAGWRKLPHIGFLQSARVCDTCLRVHTDCKLLTFTFTFDV